MSDIVELRALAAAIVEAHVTNNRVPVSDLPGLIRATYDALVSADAPASPEPEPEVEPVPAVSVRKSLANPMRIVSMIDGKPYASLVRHLNAHGLTPDAYRKRFGLKRDYPMVAPGYSSSRSAHAKTRGFGRKAATPQPEVPENAAAALEPAEPSPAPKRRGRPPKLQAAADERPVVAEASPEPELPIDAVEPNPVAQETEPDLIQLADVDPEDEDQSVRDEREDAPKARRTLKAALGKAKAHLGGSGQG